MEMLEMELIKKLQNTQAIQKQAYGELENALAKPSAFIDHAAKKRMLTGDASVPTIRNGGASIIGGDMNRNNGPLNMSKNGEY
jgi:hypothetical protein